MAQDYYTLKNILHKIITHLEHTAQGYYTLGTYGTRLLHTKNILHKIHTKNILHKIITH